MSGELPGQVLNQFSLSEYEEAARASSTEGSVMEAPTGKSFVTTLDERDGKPVQLGQVGGSGRASASSRSASSRTAATS